MKKSLLFFLLLSLNLGAEITSTLIRPSEHENLHSFKVTFPLEGMTEAEFNGVGIWNIKRYESNEKYKIGAKVYDELGFMSLENVKEFYDNYELSSSVCLEHDLGFHVRAPIGSKIIVYDTHDNEIKRFNLQ